MSLFRADLHVHTDASPDGRSPLAAIARAARRAGLDAVAVTDHELPPENREAQISSLPSA